MNSSGAISICWLSAGMNLLVNSFSTAERVSISARVVSNELCVSAGRISTIRFSRAGPTASILLNMVTAIKPAPTTITNLAIALFTGSERDRAALDVLSPEDNLAFISHSVLQLEYDARNPISAYWLRIDGKSIDFITGDYFLNVFDRNC